ncbi:hypothetical protein TNCV_2981561 [Trichonephila clavipes]|nr:hypothetical protein TNCV_2981561 [Trichonephila clavipes]
MAQDSEVRCRQFSGSFVGCGSPVVKVSDHGRHVMSSNPVPLKTHHPSSRKSSREVGGRGRVVGSSLPPSGDLTQNWGGNEPNRTVTCIVLKATTNDMRHLALCDDEFPGPRSGLCR